jgi:hypothetical protein
MLDKDLRPEHIQSISNASEVVGFFSYLGYNTSERITQFPSNLGITNETLLKEIKKIELIANQENLLQVYLFELSSVTIANTQALVRVFRNRVGNYLLVLTSDYNRIDFVLIERVLPDDKTEGIVTKQASIRPRILTVDRLKPTRIDQRVLRRFSYTEADPIAQYEKLQAAYIVADWSEEFFNNRALFSGERALNRLTAASGSCIGIQNLSGLGNQKGNSEKVFLNRFLKHSDSCTRNANLQLMTAESLTMNYMKIPLNPPLLKGDVLLTMTKKILPLWQKKPQMNPPL